ncbi:hypothetical protein [Paraburkholderia sp. Cpub6]|uniref:hypothetical protein n=1 Tax=Paraburkholderia sp. Cpub6 TaxID=2723094 RepID=UPI00161A816D|nr:hypothetical protein [Paraburkholderia sp. Cpub6]MBB5456896.1 hypothetical protein [Paraburkholderia sp. Cpub6]
MKSRPHPEDGRTLASVFPLPALAGERSWAYVMRRVARVLEANHYAVRRDELHPARSDDLESSLLSLCGQVGRVIAEHPGAKLVAIDCFEHAHTPGRVWIVTELSSGHLHGITIPLIDPLPARSTVIYDDGPLLMLEGVP